MPEPLVLTKETVVPHLILLVLCWIFITVSNFGDEHDSPEALVGFSMVVGTVVWIMLEFIGFVIMGFLTGNIP